MTRALLAALLCAASASAQTFQERVAATKAPAWLAYTVPIVAGQHHTCNWNERGKLMLEGAREMTVLFRVEHRAVQKIRVAAGECEIDSGGLPLQRLQVAPAESITVLAGLAEQDSALHAISLHREPAAAATLARLAREHASARVRGKALFWLASSAQRTIAQDQIARAIDRDPETEVKRSAVMALCRLPAGEGVPKLIDLAQTNRNAEVRKQAMFWLGQSRDPRAVDFFEKMLGR